MSLRTRTRFKYGAIGKGRDPIPYWTRWYDAGGGEHVGSVAAEPHSWLSFSEIKEWPFDTLYRPIDHYVIRNTYVGSSVPDPAANGNLYQAMSYQTSGIAPNSWNIQLPVRYMVDAVVRLMPQVFLKPKLSNYGWDKRFNGSAEVVSQFKPSLNTGFSLINFLIQFRDVRTILNHYFKQKSAVKNVKRIARQIRKGGWDAAKELANQRLEYEYGTKQFVRDLARLLSILKNWRERADEFLAKADKPQYKSQLVDLDIVEYRDLLVSRLPWAPFGVTENESYIDWKVTSSLQGHATLVYVFHIPEMRHFIARLAQFCDQLGVSPDGSIAWDAIPFTFIADWFVNVSDWLHRQRHDWVKAEVTYREFGRSAKLGVTYDLYWTKYEGATLGWTSSLFFSRQYSRYVRELAELPDANVPRLENPENWSIDRIINATALIAQRVKTRGSGGSTFTPKRSSS